VLDGADEDLGRASGQPGRLDERHRLDWVVKLIDVYPDEVGDDAVLGGYQLMIAADIFRGRYRESFAKATPLTPDKPLL